MQEFYISWNQPCNGPSGAGSFSHALISVNRLENRKSPFPINKWLLDSGAFTRLSSGKEHLDIKKYAEIATRFSSCGNLKAVVCQDIIPEAAKTTVTLAQHITIENYYKLRSILPEDIYVMPVLQGERANEYIDHLVAYGVNLDYGDWVGVGSLVRKDPQLVENIIMQIKLKRPDLKLHGFGVKKKQIQNTILDRILYSADSAAGAFLKRSSSTDKIRFSQKYATDVLNHQSSPNIFQYQDIKAIEDPELSEEVRFRLANYNYSYVFDYEYHEDLDTCLYEMKTPFD